MAKEKNVYYGTGRRKSSIAKVKLVSGKGKITVNGKDVHEYLPYETLIMDLMQPLVLTKTNEMFDIEVNELLQFVLQILHLVRLLLYQTFHLF